MPTLPTLTELILLPKPRTLTAREGCCALPRRMDPAAVAADPRLRPAADLLLRALRAHPSAAVGALAGAGAASVGSVSFERAVSGVPPQGYRLALDASGIRIRAGDPAGAFYAVQTLCQILGQCDGVLPCGTIEDAPDLPVRGFMLDVSRDKVPTLETVLALVDDLSRWKINRLELYIEHTFAYARHRTVWAEASPFTADEIRRLDTYCRERFVELVPNQNSFGHMERWLRHPEYRSLAECPDGFRAADGAWRSEPTTLDPTQPSVLEFLDGLYAELLPNFTSRDVNIGCDETWELGQGRSRAACEQLGQERVYLDFVKALGERLRRGGRRALYWGDMVWKHFGGQLDRLDRDMVMLDWGYYRAYPFDRHGEALARAGVPFMVAPGTSVWCTLLGCNEAGLGSNRSAVEAGVRHGALGVLNTHWGDGGHWAHLSVGYLPIAAGAAMAWGAAANDDATIRAASDRHVYEDDASRMGQVAWQFGDTWEQVGRGVTQSHILDRILRGGFGHTPPATVTAQTLAEAEESIGRTLAELPHCRMRRQDGDWIAEEYTANAAMARHACRLGRAVLEGRTGEAATRRELARELGGIIEEHQRLWLRRNRPGGLSDSLRVFRDRLAEYGE